MTPPPCPPPPRCTPAVSVPAPRNAVQLPAVVGVNLAHVPSRPILKLTSMTSQGSQNRVHFVGPDADAYHDVREHAVLTSPAGASGSGPNSSKTTNSDSVIPKLNSAAVDAYLETFDKKLEKISIEMYGEGYINFVRFSKQQYFFVKAECRAQMKLQVAYAVDICINEAGTVQECQCECAVGMGPTAHCKHVAAVLYGLCQFSESGEFVTAQTCTQKLQTFHQTKKHLGTPVKAENLSVQVYANIDYDPRPPQLVQQDGYETYFKNTVVNSGVMCTAPISQIIYPANPIMIMSVKLTPLRHFCTAKE